MCSTIDPGCQITVSFDACADLFPSTGQPVTLGVWALSQLPNPMELPPVTCNGLLYDNSGNLIGTCIGEETLPTTCETNPINFSSFSVSESFTAPVTHIWFFQYPDHSEATTEVMLDNISVTTDCQNAVTVAPTVLEACVDAQGVVDLQVCLTGTQGSSATVTLTPDLSGIPGVTLSPVNPDFPNGVATVTGLASGQCSTPTLFLDIDVNVPPGVPITIPVQVSVSGGTACAQSPDIEITLVPENCDSLQCGCPPGSIVIGDTGVPTLLSDLVPGTLPQFPTLPLNLTIKGTLVIDPNVITGTQDGSYTFPLGSDICMDAGAEILVRPNNTLLVLETHVRGCSTRWKSLTVENDATLVIARETLVEDGQYAVHPFDESIVSITNSRFNKNYISLYFNNPVGEFTLQPFLGNTMECTTNLLPHFDSQDPNDGPWSYAGIYAKGQDFLNIGVQGPSPNSFDNLRNGIITVGCNLSLRNSSFDNIQNLDYPSSGRGVVASSLGLHLFSQDGSCFGANTVFFDDCLIGISLKGMNAEVHNNTMNNVGTGVWVGQSPNADIEICGNIINSTYRGITLWFNDPAQRIQMNNNAIDVNAPVFNDRAAAIYVREHGVTQPDANIEFHSDISVFNAGAGISLGSCSGYSIEQNSITASRLGSDSYAGISLWKSHRLFLGCNQVDGDFETNGTGDEKGPFGIRVRGCTNTAYECNDLQDTYLGVQFDMPCTATQFRTTTFSHHRYGLHYTEIGETGLQPNQSEDPLNGNRWLGIWGTANAVGARHESTDEDFVNASQYLVPSISAPSGPENPESVSNSWFLEEIRPELSCGSTCNVWMPEDPPTDGVDDQIARGQLAPDVYVAPTQWLMQRQLYRRLHDDPSLIVSGSVLDSFFLAQANTTIGQFTEVEAATHALFGLDSTTTAQLQGYNQQVKGKMAEVAGIDTLLLTATGQDSLDLLAQREVAAAVIDSLSQLNTALATSILQNRSLQANAVIAQNNAIATDSIWEDNEKTVNSIFLNTFAKGIAFNGTQTGLLQGIAGQCPYLGGTAVFSARAMLSGLTEDVFDDGVLCAQGGGQQGLVLPPASNTASPSQVQVYPNPADRELTVRFDRATEGNMEIRLLNLYGQVLSSNIVPEQARSHTLQLPDLPNGIYWLAIYSGDVLKEAKRVVINR